MADYIEPKDAFQDHGVASAYRFRPPYPEELIRRLAAFAPGPDDRAIDLGCGTGDIARRLAPHVAHISAIDPSAAMLAIARRSEGGNAENIAWHCSTAEAFRFPTPSALIVAAESIHWMDLDIVFAKARPALNRGGVFAVVGRDYEAPWDEELRALIPQHSATRDFVAFDPHALEGPGRLKIEEEVITAGSEFRQSIDDYVERQHSSAGFARIRMGDEPAARFDQLLRELLEPHADDGYLTFQVAASLRWGRMMPLS